MATKQKPYPASTKPAAPVKTEAVESDTRADSRDDDSGESKMETTVETTSTVEIPETPVVENPDVETPVTPPAAPTEQQQFSEHAISGSAKVLEVLKVIEVQRAELTTLEEKVKEHRAHIAEFLAHAQKTLNSANIAAAAVASGPDASLIAPAATAVIAAQNAFNALAATAAAASPAAKGEKVGIKKQVRDLLVHTPEGLTIEQIMEVTGATATAIRTHITDLKNPKYAGGDILSVVKLPDGKYVLEEHKNTAVMAALNALVPKSDDNSASATQ